MNTPTAIKVRKQSRVLQLLWPDYQAELAFEYLRVLSPSAEVRGHGQGNEVLQVGKQDVELLAVTPVGHYGLQLSFNDGHDSGIFSWDYLYQLSEEHDRRWADYLQRLQAAGASRVAENLLFKSL